jgi:hypothetical protein
MNWNNKEEMEKNMHGTTMKIIFNTKLKFLFGGKIV